MDRGSGRSCKTCRAPDSALRLRRRSYRSRSRWAPTSSSIRRRNTSAVTAVIGGVAITNGREIAEQVAFHQNCVGAVPGPWDAYLTMRGAKMLGLRMRAHSKNAQTIAEFLAGRDDGAEVYFPGFATHPQHGLAKRQMSGFGGIVSFRPKGGAERARAIAISTSVFALAVSLGGVESLICSPARMTHASLTPQQPAELDITDDLLRLSVGIEEVEDLLGDLTCALDSVPELVRLRTAS